MYRTAKCEVKNTFDSVLGMLRSVCCKRTNGVGICGGNNFMLSNSYHLFYFLFLLYDYQSYTLIGLIIVPEKPHYERLSFVFPLARLIFYSSILISFQHFLFW